MLYRHLGTSDIAVSVIGLGLAALGRPGYINIGHGADLIDRTERTALEHHTHEILDAAIASGVTYVDAARSYGRAEQFLSTWLTSRQVSREDVAVGSKWGYTYAAEWSIDAAVHEIKTHTRETLVRQYGESVALVGTHLRLYQIHSATHESGVLENAEVLAELANLRERGLVIGLSTSGPRQADTIQRTLEIEIDGRLRFGAVQATWNLLERSAGGALSDAADAGLGVIVKEAVANGRLAVRNRDTADRLQQVAPEWSPDAIAIAACLHQPWSSVVLSGATTLSQLSSNLQALEVPRSVTEQLTTLREPSGEYWAKRASLPWN